MRGRNQPPHCADFVEHEREMDHHHGCVDVTIRRLIVREGKGREGKLGKDKGQIGQQAIHT